MKLPHTELFNKAVFPLDNRIWTI